MSDEKIRSIEEKIADLKSRWPPHSVKPEMWMELEQLEDELEAAKKDSEKPNHT